MKIVGLMPALVLDAYFEDFKDFVDFQVSRCPGNAAYLAECLRSVAVLSISKLDSVTERIVAGIDYYDREALTARLIEAAPLAPVRPRPQRLRGR